jgi:cytochrome c oxidase subunit IV
MSEKVLGPQTYYRVFAALIALTFATVTVGFIDIGQWHVTVGLAFGVAKASLVILFFMHLIHSTRLTIVVALAGLFWLGILIVLTMADYATRDWLSY